MIINPPTEFAQIAVALLQGEENPQKAYQACQNFDISPRAKSVLQKNAVAAISLGDETGQTLADWAAISDTFYASLRNRSVFLKGLAEGSILRVPFRALLACSVSTAAGSIVAEGGPAPLLAMIASGLFIEPVKAVALAVLSKAVVDMNPSQSLALVEAALNDAVAAAVDLQFFAQIADSSSDLGGSSDSFGQDLQALLAFVNTRAGGRLVWAMAPDVANQAAAFDEKMSPSGGTILNLPAVSTNAVPSGTMRLIDLARIAGNAEPAALRTTRHGSVSMSDAPSSPTNLVNLWQSGLIGAQVAIPFAVKALSENCIASIDSIEWTNP